MRRKGNVIHSQEKKQSIDNNSKMTEMLELVYKDFKSSYYKYAWLKRKHGHNETQDGKF